jgi:trypsin
MKVSALLLAQLLIASSAEARLFQRTRDTNRAREKDDDTDRIINGVEAEEDRYSYMVSLKDNQGHFCGASLIAKDIVLSAAHCAGGGYDAIIGRHKHNDNDGDKVRVSKEFIHPKYNDQATNNDFMVLKLSRETKAGTPVKINSSRSTPQDNQNVVVMGFGVTNENTQQTSNKLMEVTVKVVSDSECRQKYGNEVIASTMICAASPSKDSCQGDSGGPLILKGSSAATDIQVGIVSWGYGCADPSVSAY